ncbi:MAG: hypothetical protein ABFQ62_01065 [Patescibacteria group bacterium]
MFRTSNIRGQQRFLDLRKLKASKDANIVLSKKQIALIENSSILTLGEKIDLLFVSLGNKLTTELFMKIRYNKSNSVKPEQPHKKDLSEIEKLLKQLPLVYFKDFLPTKRNKQTGKLQNFTWFQVSVNKVVSKFMKKYPDDLTEFEEGVLYGFPLSAIRAFSGLIEARYDKPTSAFRHMSGVCSKDFWSDEREYYELWWERLRKLSPNIIQEAEQEFIKNNK